MPFLESTDRQKRIVQLSQHWGLVLPEVTPLLVRPAQAPSFRNSHNDQTAERDLQRRAAAQAQARPKSTISRAFSSNNLKRGKAWDPKLILDALRQCVLDSGPPGVAEALIAKLGAAGVDLGGVQKQKTNRLTRRKSMGLGEDRTQLLRCAVERQQVDMLQVLLPHADSVALDANLAVAISTGNAEIVTLMLVYGANISESVDGLDAFRQACMAPNQSAMVAAILQSDNRPPPLVTSQALTDAVRAGCLENVLHLSRSTADGNHNQAEALKLAVQACRRDLAVAIIMGNRPPLRPGLDEAFHLAFTHQQLDNELKLDMSEILLCAGAQGDTVSHALQVSCEFHWLDMVRLLASYGASIDYNQAAALRMVIERDDLDTFSTLLTDRALLDPKLASTCVACISKSATSEVRNTMLQKLLWKGASGEALDKALVNATSVEDLVSVKLLLDANLSQAAPNVLHPSSAQPSNHHAARIATLEGGESEAPIDLLSSHPSEKTLSSENLLSQKTLIGSSATAFQPNYLSAQVPKATRRGVASVDYRDGEALRIAVANASIDIIRVMLASRPSETTLSAVFPLTHGLPGEQRHQVVQLLLGGSLSGVSLHKALQQTLMDERDQRDHMLINLLLRHGADTNFEAGIGLQPVIANGNVELLSTLIKNVSPTTAAARLVDGLALRETNKRCQMVELLFYAGAGANSKALASALSTVLQETPVDTTLLRLISERGQPVLDVSAKGTIQLAVREPDPQILDLVLSCCICSADTTRYCLEQVAQLPSTDEKAFKIKTIVSRAQGKTDLDWLLLQEVHTLSQPLPHQKPSLATLKQLLQLGADPNSSHGGALQNAVKFSLSQVFELLFVIGKPPSPSTVTNALPHALRIVDPMDRLSFTKKLVDSQAYPAEVNRALVYAITHYAQDLALISCLAKSADTSDGEALLATISQESLGLLDLLIKTTRHDEVLRGILLIKAMEVRKRSSRRDLCQLVLKAGVSADAASKALTKAAGDGDIDLGDLLLSYGASMSSNNNQAVVEACRGGSPDVLRILLKSGPQMSRKILEDAFQAATAVRDLNKRAGLFDLLLTIGSVSNEILDQQLLSATKYGAEGLELLKVLLNSGADPNYHNGEAVLAAISMANIDGLELLLGLWVEGVNQKKASNATLSRAIQASFSLGHESRFRVIEDLFRAGLPNNAAVHITLNQAINEKDCDHRLISFLLNHGASPSANDNKTVFDATKIMNPGLLELVLAKDVSSKVASRAFQLGFTKDAQIKWFTKTGLEVAKMLLEKGATGASLTDALIVVMETSTESTTDLANRFFDLLISHDPDVNADGGEPLKLAASRANIHWTRELLKLGPSEDTIAASSERIFDTAIGEADALSLFDLYSNRKRGDDQMDATASQASSARVLTQALTQYPRSTGILQALLNTGYYHDCMVNHQIRPDFGEESLTLLAWAIAQPQKRVSTAVLEVLLGKGANVNTASSVTMTTPLMLAIQSRRPDVVKMLLLEGAEVEVVDALGQTPLSMTTSMGGDLAIEIMGSVLAADPAKDDGSVHNAARDLNLAAVKVLVHAGHDPDFPSPLHGGRSALSELCLHGTDAAELSTEKERQMTRMMTYLIDAGSDLTIKSKGLSLLHQCFHAEDPVGASRALLKSGVWKQLKDASLHYVDENYTYSPTMYVAKVLPATDKKDALLELLRANRAVDVYYANEGTQPPDAKGLPENIKLREEERKARQQRLDDEFEDFARSLARKKELASVEQKIWQQQAQMEDARRQKLHLEDISLLKSRAALEDSLAGAATQRKLSEQRVLQDAAISRTRAVAAAELASEDTRQKKMLEWETVQNTNSVENARAVSNLRIGEREEIERLDKVADQRMRQRFEAQNKLLDRQEKLAKQITPSGQGLDARRQIGFVQELN